MEASLKLSYDGLDEPTRSVLCQLSVFATRFNETAVNRVIRIKGDTEAALELLQRRYLLERDSTTGMYNLHDLVREFGFSQLRNRNSVYQRARVWYNEVAHSTSEEAAAILRLLTSEELHRFTTRRRQIKEFLAQEDRRQSKQGSSGANRSNDET